MHYRRLLHTDLSPSVLCLGTASFGTTVDRQTAFHLLDTFFAQGGTFLDTAHVYGGWVPGGLGLSETVIGQWMKERRVREQVVIGTKGAHPALATMDIPRVTRQDILADLDASLQCLQTEWIDIYWLHRDDPQQPVALLLDVLTEQVARGKIRSFGCSNWSLERIREAMKYADEHQIKGFVGNQLMWSLAVPNQETIDEQHMVVMDAQMQSFHREKKLAIVAYSSQAQGFFTKMSTNPASLSEGVRRRYRNAENTERLSRLQKIAQARSLPLAAASLAYLTNQPLQTFPIFSCTSIEQLLENMQASDVVFDAPLLRYLEQGDEQRSG